VALLELRECARILAERFGCTAQVLAASRTACVEAFRRLPQPHGDAMPAAVALIDDAADGAALAATGSVIRRLPLSAFQRGLLRERYAGRLLSWPPKAA
jgi:hypothetical protein